MKLTKEKFLDLNSCADAVAFAKSVNFDAVKGWQTCERGDWLIWLLRKTNNLDKPTAVKIAIACAERVLTNFEKKYPDDKRPEMAILAAEKWLANPTLENQNAAAAAHASASAAYAAAADAAADAAAADAYAAAIKEQLENYLSDIIEEF